MVQWWDDLTFLHWRFRSEDVQRLLPQGLDVDSCDGSAWVSLVPFFLQVGLPRVRPVPWMCRFPETNVRTYVRDRDGASGVWFFSLDAARLGAVLVARSGYRLPYLWSRMRLERSGSTVRYESRRRWPGPRGARSRVEIAVGEPYAADELSELDHFLTARWALYSTPRSGLHRARAAHAPWPLHRAELLHLDDELVAAAGLPAPDGDPIVHWSPSVEVRIGWPEPVAR
jgi:uncharacterized protein YqjF (DUF2071 family)